MRSALVGLAFLLLPAAGWGQVALAGERLAITRCAGGQPITAINPLLDSATSHAVAIHEAVHRRQLAPACDSLMALYRADPARWMAAEAEALCLSAVNTTQYGPPRVRAMSLAVLLLRDAFPAVSDSTLATVFGRACFSGG